MTKVNTLFGSFDDEQLKKLKGYIDESVMYLNRNKSNTEAMNDIVNIAYDELKIPKKIITKIAKTYHKQSLTQDIQDHEDFVELYDKVTK